MRYPWLLFVEPRLWIFKKCKVFVRFSENSRENLHEFQIRAEKKFTNSQPQRWKTPGKLNLKKVKRCESQRKRKFYEWISNSAARDFVLRFSFCMLFSATQIFLFASAPLSRREIKLWLVYIKKNKRNPTSKPPTSARWPFNSTFYCFISFRLCFALLFGPMSMDSDNSRYSSLVQLSKKTPSSLKIKFSPPKQPPPPSSSGKAEKRKFKFEISCYFCDWGRRQEGVEILRQLSPSPLVVCKFSSHFLAVKTSWKFLINSPSLACVCVYFWFSKNPPHTLA